MPDTSRCDEVRELLPELAAGVAAGDARAAALAHLAGCADCRRELEEHSDVLDALLLLAPEHEPSPGFESSVLAALAPAQRPRHRPGAVLLAAAASVLALALAVGVAWWQASGSGTSGTVAADITAATSTVAGQAVARQGDPPWVYLDLDAAPAPGRYLVRLVTAEGRTLDVGWCRVRAGKGSWGWPVDVPPDELSEVRLVRNGEIAMRGTFE
jgi:hypothetical protein